MKIKAAILYEPNTALEIEDLYPGANQRGVRRYAGRGNRLGRHRFLTDNRMASGLHCKTQAPQATQSSASWKMAMLFW